MREELITNMLAYSTIFTLPLSYMLAYFARAARQEDGLDNEPASAQAAWQKPLRVLSNDFLAMSIISSIGTLFGSIHSTRSITISGGAHQSGPAASPNLTSIDRKASVRPLNRPAAAYALRPCDSRCRYNLQPATGAWLPEKFGGHSLPSKGVLRLPLPLLCDSFGTRPNHSLSAPSRCSAQAQADALQTSPACSALPAYGPTLRRRPECAATTPAGTAAVHGSCHSSPGCRIRLSNARCA